MIEQGNIYVAPPDHHLLLEQGSVHLGTGPKERHVRPAANVLFRSAAHWYGPRVVGVILTGSGQDGADGLLTIRQHGGVTVIQDPDDAAWSSMPQRALEQVEVDYTLPLVRLASLLIHITSSSHLWSTPDRGEASCTRGANIRGHPGYIVTPDVTKIEPDSVTKMINTAASKPLGVFTRLLFVPY
jgi:two-component system chemotaxis response regulator CheB